MSKQVKLSDKQKEVVRGLRAGCRIYISESGRPGNVGRYTRLRYTDGKGKGGRVTSATLNALKRIGLLDIAADGRFRTVYTLTSLGKTINID